MGRAADIDGCPNADPVQSREGHIAKKTLSNKTKPGKRENDSKGGQNGINERAQISVFVLIVFWVFLLTRPPCPVAPCQRFGRDFRRCSGTGVCKINVDCKNEVIRQPLSPSQC